MSAIAPNSNLVNFFQFGGLTAHEPKLIVMDTAIKKPSPKEKSLGEEHKPETVQGKNLKTRISSIDWWMQELGDTLESNSTGCYLPEQCC